MTERTQQAKLCDFPSCPESSPHGHCGAQACIVPKENDGEYCADCVHQMDLYYQQEQRDQEYHAEMMREIYGEPEW